MFIKTLFAAALLMILGAMGWRYLGPDTHRKAASASPLVSAASPAPPASAAAEQVPPGQQSRMVDAEVPGTVRGVRKCKKGDAVVYTDQTCPKGMQELRVVERPLTVLPSIAVPKKVNSPLLPSASDEPSMRAKQMERVVNQ